MYLQNILAIAQKKLSQNNFVALKQYVKKIVIWLKHKSEMVVKKAVQFKKKLRMNEFEFLVRQRVFAQFQFIWIMT